jgi:hypothetical protein
MEARKVRVPPPATNDSTTSVSVSFAGLNPVRAVRNSLQSTGICSTYCDANGAREADMQVLNTIESGLAQSVHDGQADMRIKSV